MKSYGVCFEFHAEKKEDAEQVRELIEVVAKAVLFGDSGDNEQIMIRNCMKPSLFEYATLHAENLTKD